MALTVRNLRWLGVSVEDPATAAAFFRITLGMRAVFEEADSIELETEAGDRVQLFGPGSSYFERAQRPFPLFEIDDARTAREELALGGIQVGRLESDDEWEWFDVVGPEGLVCELGSRR
ncbi:MAG TPA: VOC family protein [Gaiellaceae bacterium]|nr:VOC family protein [Gaiellaceae bacterium]